MARRSHLLVVMGDGGHSKECLRLIELMGPDTYRYSYVLTKDDVVTEPKLPAPGRVFRLTRPGGKDASLRSDLINYPRALAQAANALLRSRPDAILSTGPAVAAPVAIMAKLLGVRIIFVETGARIHGLSMTGSFMRHVADLYFVQWEELRAAAPRSIFAGRLF